MHGRQKRCPHGVLQGASIASRQMTHFIFGSSGVGWPLVEHPPTPPRRCRSCALGDGTSVTSNPVGVRARFLREEEGCSSGSTISTSFERSTTPAALLEPPLCVERLARCLVDKT
mmetsp:Transcript_35927/g.78402  ORF Transcript_35927/g.78402 Transcript_35927/m.78402 type:complete len:115 (-) Transcript_35927:602-946(-)